MLLKCNRFSSETGAIRNTVGRPARVSTAQAGSYSGGMKTAKSRTTTARHFDSLEQEAFLNLWRTYDRLHAIEEELFARYNLTPQQYNALRLLRGCHPQKLPTLVLAGRLVSRAADITRLLDKLEKQGFIQRARPEENRRTVLVAITAEGRAVLARLDAQIRASHERQLGHMSRQNLQTLVGLLREARRPHEEEESNWK